MSKNWQLQISQRTIEDGVFRFCLGASLAAHLVTAVLLVTTHRKYQKPLPKELEIVYQVPTSAGGVEHKVETLVKTFKKTSQTMRPEILTRENSAPASLIQEEMARQSTGLSLPEKAPGKHLAFSTKSSISIPVLQAEKISNAKYMSYNERIRQKIKNRAYFYIDHPDFESGEVYLTFVLLASGELKEVQIIDAQSRGNEYLRGAGLRSIKESVPFPPFPGDLKYPELTFNVLISFTIEDVPDSP